MPQFIPVNEPLLDGNEKRYLAECIDTGWISSEGPFVQRLEESMAQRAYYQGVCDSYTRIRADGKVREAAQTWKSAAGHIKRFCIDRRRANQTALERVQSRTAKGYQRGYGFHQREVSRERNRAEQIECAATLVGP